MAGTPGGLTTSIRRKLQGGKSPDEVVQELVAGGLTEVSAQRFVDRAMTEDASAAPLPPLPESGTAGDSLDQFIQTKSAEAETAAARTGGKQLWIGSALMCGGIIVSAVSYLMADVGERYIMMWGPMLFGLLTWGQAVFKGREDGHDFAWSTAVVTLAVPIVLAGAAFGVVTAMTPDEEEGLLQAQMDEIFDPSKSAAKSDSTAITIKESAPASAQPGVQELLTIFENNRSAAIQCEIARRLGEVSEDEKAIAAVSLMAQLGNTPDGVKICIGRAMKKLEPRMALQIYDDWSRGTNQTLKDAALKDRP